MGLGNWKTSLKHKVFISSVLKHGVLLVLLLAVDFCSVTVTDSETLKLLVYYLDTSQAWSDLVEGLRPSQMYWSLF